MPNYVQAILRASIFIFIYPSFVSTAGFMNCKDYTFPRVPILRTEQARVQKIPFKRMSHGKLDGYVVAPLSH